MRTVSDWMTYLIEEHELTLISRARKYAWLSDSWEDVYHDLLPWVARCLSTYSGKMVNMNSLVTMITNRTIHEMCRNYYSRKVQEVGFDSFVEIMVVDVQDSMFELDIETLDKDLKEYLLLVMSGVTRIDMIKKHGYPSDILDYLNEKAKEFLADYFGIGLPDGGCCVQG